MVNINRLVLIQVLGTGSGRCHIREVDEEEDVVGDDGRQELHFCLLRRYYLL